MATRPDGSEPSEKELQRKIGQAGVHRQRGQLSHVRQGLVLPELNTKIRKMFGFDGLLNQVRPKPRTRRSTSQDPGIDQGAAKTPITREATQQSCPWSSETAYCLLSSIIVQPPQAFLSPTS